MNEGTNSVLQSIEEMSQLSADVLFEKNASGDWRKIETWAAEMLQQDYFNNSSQVIYQRSIETDIIVTILNRVKGTEKSKGAKGNDCMGNWDNFYKVFSEWKEKFYEENKERENPTSFISVIETDLLQKNLAMYRNGDHSSKRVEVLLFYFRKQAGRNFLEQVTLSALYPKAWVWTSEEVNSIKEQLDEQFSSCIEGVEEPLHLSLLEKHRQLQGLKNDTLWWLADACLQDCIKDERKFNILNKITYYCYKISQDDKNKKMQADQTLARTYQNYNPLAGNFVFIYNSNFSKNKLDDLEIKDNERKKKRIEKKLKGKYEGEELEREIEKELERERNISIDAPINDDDTDSSTIGSIFSDDGLSPEEEISGSQIAIFLLQAFAEIVNSRKHLAHCDDDLFFTEIVSQMIRESKHLAEHVHKDEKLYAETCNLDFLNFYLQQSVITIYESRECPLKKIQDFHPEEQNPEYARECGFPLENIVYKQFIHAKSDSNITGKRKTFQKHMQACLNGQGLMR